MIDNSVGSFGTNSFNDALIIQIALNVWRANNGRSAIAVDGLVGPETTGAIVDFQRSNGFRQDGRIDVNGPTLARLRSLIGSDVEIFVPAVTQLLDVFGTMTEAVSTAPPKLQGIYSST